jgi:hypothetical protein
MKPVKIICIIIAVLIMASQAQNLSYLQNDSVRIGVRMDMGGGIASFSLLSPLREILNAADEGRMIQQSWYGDNDGSNWNGRSWCWNPIQGGCWTGVRGIVLASSRINKTLYVKTRPINWGGCDTINAPMEEWIRLAGRVAHIHFKFVNNGRNNTAFKLQEMPAVFMDYSLRTLVYYKGAAPWTDNAALVRRNAPSGTQYWFLDTLTENWLAYVDGTDWGAGVYTPGTSNFCSYWIDQSCAYFAPIRYYTINNGFTLEYDVYVYIGNLSAMRTEFDYIHKNGRPSVPYDSELVAINNLASGIAPAKALGLTINNGQIVFHVMCQGAYALRVFDAVGNARAIYRGHDQGRVAVASAMLSRGVYFAQLKHAQGSATIKFVVY